MFSRDPRVPLVPAGYPERNKAEFQNKQRKSPKVSENKLICMGCPEHVLASGQSAGERLTLCAE